MGETARSGAGDCWKLGFSVAAATMQAGSHVQSVHTCPTWNCRPTVKKTQAPHSTISRMAYAQVAGRQKVSKVRRGRACTC